jgi:ribosomal-protein-alanine N-acetyltransferase
MPIVSERLILRPFAPDDLDAFAAINADPEVMRHFAARRTRAETAEMIEALERRRREDGLAFSAAIETASGRLVGMIGLQRVTADMPFAPTVEVGWRLARDVWGRGYASEGARAAIADGFDRLGLPEIVAFTRPDNLRSRAVMERLGMRRDPTEDFDHPKLAADHPMRRHVLYRLSRPARCDGAVGPRPDLQ